MTRHVRTGSARKKSRRRSGRPVGKRLVLAVTVVAAFTAGCTTSASGQPTAEQGGAPSSESSTSTSETPGSDTPTVEVPPRPRDISLDGLDPCTLYTDAQRAQLNADDVDSGEETGSQHFKGMKECTIAIEDQEPFYDYSALAVTTEGVEAWLTGNRNVDAELTSVQGFPAAQFKFRGVEDEGCDFAVGVADGQNLWVQIMPITPGFEQEELCQMARQATEMAMTTLQTLK
ncbi:MAG: DUF3558 domain-containing protein [Actinophytocola sp.]|uniref:DUF3558 domain-containing protein n=1 Tax=Actinophytocola sp. TaxID=1872138 RepID=UPI003C74C8F5